MFPPYRPVVTVIDVLETKACIQGVLVYLLKHPLISGEVNKESNPHILKASNGDGYGDGYGNGNGYGDGNGNGYGDGSGSGNDYGSGYG